MGVGVVGTYGLDGWDERLMDRWMDEMGGLGGHRETGG